MTTARLDRRQGQTWTRAQSLKNGVIAVLVRAGVLGLPRLPRGVLVALGQLLAGVAFVIFGRGRRAARLNLKQAYPDASPRARRALLVRTYSTLGRHLGEAIASLHTARPLAPLAIEDADLALLAGHGRGVVFASAHLGPWERVAATLIARGAPMTVIARESYDPRLDLVYARLRDARGVPVVYRGEPGAGVRMARVLRRNGVLGIPMDFATRAPSVPSLFLDRDARTAVGPARLALRMGADVVVGTVARRIDGALGITCTRIDARDLAPGEDGERALTRRIDAELSRRILALPEHWPWMHERFARPSSVENKEPAPRSSSVVFSDPSP